MKTSLRRYSWLPLVAAEEEARSARISAVSATERMKRVSRHPGDMVTVPVVFGNSGPAPPGLLSCHAFSLSLSLSLCVCVCFYRCFHLSAHRSIALSLSLSTFPLSFPHSLPLSPRHSSHYRHDGFKVCLHSTTRHEQGSSRGESRQCAPSPLGPANTLTQSQVHRAESQVK